MGSTGSSPPHVATELHARIQHHPSRAELLPELLRKLEPFTTDVITDDPAATIRSPWRVYLRCVTEPWDGTHLLVIQDDARPAEGFAQAALSAIRAAPDRVLCLFMQGTPPPVARAVRNGRDGTFVELQYMTWLPAVATVWPRDMADGLALWGRSLAVARRQRADDGVLWKYVKSRGGALVTVPSIVQHDDVVPSIMVGAKRQSSDGWRSAARYMEDVTELRFD